MQMKTKLGFLTKLTVGGLVTVAVALWMQWLSGDHMFPMVLGSLFLAMGLVSGRTWGRRERPGVAFGHGTVGPKVQRY